MPYGGTVIGRVSMIALAQTGTNVVVQTEGLARVSEVLEGGIRWSLSFVLRGWDRDSVQLLFPDGYSEGSETQHAVFDSPGIQKPGSSALSRAVKILLVPDDAERNPGLIIYRGVPDWASNAEMLFQLPEEFVIPVSIECVQDSSGRILSIGRIHDLTVS